MAVDIDHESCHRPPFRWIERLIEIERANSLALVCSGQFGN